MGYGRKYKIFLDLNEIYIPGVFYCADLK